MKEQEKIRRTFLGRTSAIMLAYLEGERVLEERSGVIEAMIEHQFRHSFGEIVAALIRRIGVSRITLAEDSAQEAMVTALKTWPFAGIPENPAGWLYRVAYNRAIDTLRSASERWKHDEAPEDLHYLSDARIDDIDTPRFSSEIEDDRLRLIFTCCHPAISLRNQIAMTLRLVSGFSPEEIAAALLTSKTAIMQQIVRAKRALRSSEVPFEVPAPRDLPGRLNAVLKTQYLVFNGGYAAPFGDVAIREDLCVEAMRIVDVLLRTSMTALPEVHALAALFSAQLSRFPARLDDDGMPVPLQRQDRNLWDRNYLNKALYHQKAAMGDNISQYHFEAAIAIEHSIAPSFAETNWQYILDSYDGLLSLTGSPIAALNRIVAISKVHGADRALVELEELQKEGSLAEYYLLPAVKAALLEDIGRADEAAAAYLESRQLSRNSAYSRWLDSQLETVNSTEG